LLELDVNLGGIIDEPDILERSATLHNIVQRNRRAKDQQGVPIRLFTGLGRVDHLKMSKSVSITRLRNLAAIADKGFPRRPLTHGRLLVNNRPVATPNVSSHFVDFGENPLVSCVVGDRAAIVFAFRALSEVDQHKKKIPRSTIQEVLAFYLS
jgi:hypothetical protein